MKKVILIFGVVFVICAITFTGSASTFPSNFSCVIEDEIIKEGISKEKHNFKYYQLSNMYRYDAFGIAYILDETDKMFYELYISIDIFSQNKTNLSAKDVLNHFGIGFLNSQYNEVEDTGKIEIINGYECKVVKVISPDKTVTKFIWQAPALGNIGLKYEESHNDYTIIKTVKELDTNFNDPTVFEMPKGGKANKIMSV